MSISKEAFPFERPTIVRVKEIFSICDKLKQDADDFPLGSMILAIQVRTTSFIMVTKVEGIEQTDSYVFRGFKEKNLYEIFTPVPAPGAVYALLRSFTLAHELGHIVLGHLPRGHSIGLVEEIPYELQREADAFSLRLGMLYPPAGVDARQLFDLITDILKLVYHRPADRGIPGLLLRMLLHLRQ